MVMRGGRKDGYWKLEKGRLYEVGERTVIESGRKDGYRKWEKGRL